MKKKTSVAQRLYLLEDAFVMILIEIDLVITDSSARSTQPASNVPVIAVSRTLLCPIGIQVFPVNWPIIIISIAHVTVGTKLRSCLATSANLTFNKRHSVASVRAVRVNIYHQH